MPDDKDPLRLYKEFREDDPAWQIHILGLRVDALTKEKEDLERSQREQEARIAAMEKTFQRGMGAMIMVPIIGSIVGFMFAYGKVIFAPWLKD